MIETTTRGTNNLSQGHHHDGQHSPIVSALTSAVNQMRSYLSPFEIEPHTAPQAAPISSVVQPSVRASAFRLEQYAWSKCAVLRSEGGASVSREAADSMKVVFRRFLRDNGPTPQVGPTPEKTIEVQWLVGGSLMSALFENSGDYNLYATGPDDSVLFDVDFDAGQVPDHELEAEALSLLSHMSKQVALRPQGFWG
ncbi:MAG: hypothetical protein JWO18_2804 [Microbacteriaceae bacterium]|nr:hypothetical protein [Microbacteriaceae bacterium]